MVSLAKKHSFHRRTRMRTAEIAGLQILFLFVLPITLLYFHIIPIETRIFVLLIFSVFIFAVIRREGWTEKDVGLVFHASKKTIKMYALATSLAFVTVVAIAQYRGLAPTHHWWTKPHFLYLFLVVSFFQEFAFRGFLMPLLKRVFPHVGTIILVNALLFAGMHGIYPIPMFGVPFAFVAGLFFATLYHKYPNLILISITHAILNFVVVWYGIFTMHH